MEPPRWNIITPSQYEWERRALDFIRAGLPNHDPYRAWTNFEFQSHDGAIYEVDLLVLTKQGFWLVEIKSWTGQLRGDAGTWTRTHQGKTISEDNPALLANRKAKALSALLKAQHAVKKIRVPWLDALVFLSADDLQCELGGPALNRVLLQDRPVNTSQPARKGMLAALLNREGPGIDPDACGKIDGKVAKALARAIEQAGIRPSQRSRRVGDYILGELLADGPGYQDRLGKHASFEDVYCRVRQYTVAQADTEEVRQRRRRAAAREFRIIQSLNHPNILPVLDYKEHELGPALLFRYFEPNVVRLDHYLATNCHTLTSEQRLNMLRQIADAVRYAHRKRVIHRALGPQSILVTQGDLGPPTLHVFNWQVGVRETTTASARVTNVEDLVEAQAFVYMAPEAIAELRERFPDVKEAGTRKGDSAHEIDGVPSLELLERRVTGPGNSKKITEGNIRSALLTPAASESSASSFNLYPSSFAWPSQSEVAEALSVSRPREQRQTARTGRTCSIWSAWPPRRSKKTCSTETNICCWSTLV